MAALVLALGGSNGVAASDQYGRVVFSGLPVPGATVSATRGDVTRVTVTDEQGIYRFVDLAEGAWTLQVEMLGFSTVRQDVIVSESAALPTVTLALRPLQEIASLERAPGGAAGADLQPGRGTAAAPMPPSPADRAGPAGFARAAVTAPPAGSPAASDAIAAAGDAGADRSGDAAEGFLVNGSVNNGAASPFAQLAAFGNNRRGPRSLYNGGVGVLFDTSAWDARPFSFAGQPAAKPVYDDVQVVGSFAGPVRIPRLLRNGPNLFLGFQHSSDHTATTQSAIVPSLAERQGDFSQAVDASGRPVRLIDPTIGLPFAGNVIPQARISQQAAGLLALYPMANVPGSRYNYQTPVLVATHQDALQTRLIESLNQKNQLFGSVSFQRTLTDAANVFGFVDSTSVSGLDVPINWSHRFSPLFSLRVRYQFTGLSTHVTPYFANRENIAGDAGITGNNQDPSNWGPPTLQFASGLASLSTAQYASNRDRTHGGGVESLWVHGRHNITAGGDLRLRHLDSVAQQNARGTLSFTGAATGSDVADFLLGIPQTSAIAFGNADKHLRASGADGYVTDDWRLSPTFTANIGMRWEFESPFSERLGRLVNLDVAPGFTAISPVLASAPTGPLTGQSYPSSLLRPDRTGFQPRVGMTWRPVAGSSLVVRGGYGIYRNTAAYQAIDLLLAQQPPFSKAFTIENGPAHPLTLANAFAASPDTTTNTFAVDPNFRVGYAHTWQLLLQRDLPWSSTVTASYLGTAGRHLMEEFLPNTYPLGASNPCPSCPAGFVYLTSNGRSSRHAGQVQLRRRLHDGLTASVQYTLSKAVDDSPAAFTGASLNGAAIAQNWLRLEDEHGPSAFDQRHVVSAQFQYTSGMGTAGGALLDGVRGSLLKGWTVTSQITAGSGLPLTPIYLTSVPGTGVTGTLRPDLTGAPPDAAPPGYYASPAAFAPPAAGHWGTAGRNSISGPAQFALNAGLGRSFLWGARLTLDWRVDATNVLNRVTYTGVNSFVGSPQFGLPLQANAMRKLQSTIRLRF